MMNGKAATKLERQRMDALTRLGCIVCLLQGRGFVPAAVHHILSGGLRMGHMYTIPLCQPGHHAGLSADSPEVSRHPYKARFEACYGSEEYLLQQVNQRLPERLRTPAVPPMEVT